MIEEELLAAAHLLDDATVPPITNPDYEDGVMNDE